MTPAYIALGSNLQRPQTQLRRAVIALETLPGTRLDAVSSIYRSTAVGPGAQPDYFNAVVRLATGLSPTELLDALQGIEHDQGRVRDLRWGPRTLDLDLLLYADMTITSTRLTVPHPRMQERHFVLYPLFELCGANLVLPDGTVLEALLRRCSDKGLVRTRSQLRTNQQVRRD